MKIRVSGYKIVSALQKVDLLVSTKTNNVQILNCYLFSVKGKVLTITSSDNYTTIKTQIEVFSEVDFEMAVSKKIFDLLKFFKDSDVTICDNKEENTIEISSYYGTYDLPYYNADSFPTEKIISEQEGVIKVNRLELLEAINSTTFATSKTETKPYLACVYFDFKDTDLTLVATDIHKFSQYKFYNVEKNKMDSFLIHNKPVSILQNILLENSAENVSIYFDEYSVSFILNGDRVSTRLVESTYVNYQEAVKKIGSNEVIIDRKYFISSLKRTNIFAEKQSFKTLLKISENKMQIITKDVVSKSKSEENLKCSYNGEPFDVTFNGKLLQEIAEKSIGDEIKIFFGEVSDPTLFYEYKENSIVEKRLMILMPLKS